MRIAQQTAQQFFSLVAHTGGRRRIWPRLPETATSDFFAQVAQKPCLCRDQRQDRGRLFERRPQAGGQLDLLAQLAPVYPSAAPISCAPPGEGTCMTHAPSFKISSRLTRGACEAGGQNGHLKNTVMKRIAEKIAKQHGIGQRTVRHAVKVEGLLAPAGEYRGDSPFAPRASPSKATRKAGGHIHGGRNTVNSSVSAPPAPRKASGSRSRSRMRPAMPRPVSHQRAS